MSASSGLLAEASAAAAAPLDLHEGIGDPLASTGCKRWPEHLRLLNQSTGELVPGRCRATNLCRYCQTLYVVETVEMLTLDAMEYAPTLWVVLTAREHLTRAECRDHLRQLRRAAQKVWPGIEWFVQVEFQRRGALHLNLLVKGVPRDDLERLYDVLTTRWCARVDADAAPFDRMHERGQWAGAIEDGVGVVRYLQKTLSHGLKREQAPPIGWRGHRTSQTRGYLVRPAAVMREEAKRSLRVGRLVYRGYDAETAALEVSLSELVEWTLHSTIDGRDELRAVAEDARRPFRDSVPGAPRRAEPLSAAAAGPRPPQGPNLSPLTESAIAVSAEALVDDG